MKGLTKRQRDIVEFIQEFIKNNRYSPSYREICQNFGFSSLGSIYKHMQALKRKGILSSESKVSRSIMLTTHSEKPETLNEIEIPFIGHIAAGMPIQTFPQRQQITIPRSFVHNPEKTYALRVQGDSLNEEFIADGDLLVVEARQEAHQGETIVALINNHDTIVKRFYQEGIYVRLLGTFANHHPIILQKEDVLIQGIVIGLIRMY
ncbi:MAG: transcriptional repressor LexA [Parachlamydiaceae bacterium]|nr:transcriptional repressor LexA [Parachlamydiaceae bacterium]